MFKGLIMAGKANTLSARPVHKHVNGSNKNNDVYSR
jgi:hypothetical protein